MGCELGSNLYVLRCSSMNVSDGRLVRHVPSWFPGAAFKRWARAARQDFERLKEHPFLQVKAEMVARYFSCIPRIADQPL